MAPGRLSVCVALLLAGCAGGGPTSQSGSGGATGATGGAGGGSRGGATAGTGGSATGASGGTSGSAGTGGGGTGGNASGGSGGNASGGSGGAAGGGAGGTGGSGGGATGGAGTAGSGGAAGGGRGGAAGMAGTGGVAGNGGVAGTGGRGGSSGASGRGGAAGGTGGTGSPCAARPGLRFCDDFESKAAGTFAAAAPWTVQAGGSSTLTIDATTPAHSGTKSVRVHAADTDYQTMITFRDGAVLPGPNGRFFLRAYLRLGRAMSGGHNSYITADAPGGANNLRIGEMNAMLMYTVMGDAHGALSNQNYYNDGKPGVAFAPSTWVCLEVLVDRARPEIDVWVDGVEVPDLHHTDWALDAYDSVRFGFEKYAGPGLDLWYDDVAIGTERIGCP